jgi:NAD(P)-dependent dehydrogenase (short-subunit alcohol dehydrogenase family)
LSKGIAPAFAKAGPRGIVLVATNAEKLAVVEAELKAINPNVQVLSVATNIADAESVKQLFAKVKATFGHADILINNAAIHSGVGPDIHEQDPDKWWQNFEVNTKGAFLLAQSFINALPSPSTPATLVNLISAAAWLVLPFMSGYGISKLAALQLVTNIAAAYPNVTAVALHPGLVDTDMLDEKFRRFDLDSPALIGGVTVWLSSDKAKFLTGRAIAANWSVDDLVARKEEIEEGNLLRMDLRGKFGKEQFE